MISRPALSRELVAYLQQVFPNRLPPITTTDRELGALIGQQQVINHLAGVLAEQEQDLLSNVRE